MEQRTLASLDATGREAVLNRDAGIDEVRQDVADIVETVRAEGDEALRSRTVQRLDEAGLASISDTVVPLAELEGLDTVGYSRVTYFDTPGCRKSSRNYSRQYESHAESVRRRFE
ncbi:hypothetical protein GCM10008995_28990 [Halobellus salinus]|uniref:Uncharacterized protein n=1 Tax=Halobellus salinus TaxID=931585 RepID=A0A830EJU9_9EURY|nr:hypothetical protein [Halobellus salinus]GGJ17395.1 hypothetical protein GCM10008995_28990 [Halobellus salinus]SMP27588.1 hypothetical protein SAMN06265347_112126 [Halobellus salinus]